MLANIQAQRGITNWNILFELQTTMYEYNLMKQSIAGVNVYPNI